MVGGWCGGSRATAGGDNLACLYAGFALDNKRCHTSAGMAPVQTKPEPGAQRCARFELFLNRRSA